MSKTNIKDRVKLKYSQFNSVLKLSDKTQILYNAFSHACIFEPIHTLPEVSELPKHLTDIYLRHGFVVPLDLDEFEMVNKTYLNTTSNPNRFILTINPTLECNFRCWYCYETHNHKMVMADETIEAIKKLVLNILQTHKEFVLSFFGGEPMLEFERIIKPLMEWSHERASELDKKIYYMFTTNGFLLNPTIIEFLSQFPCQPFQITLDGGRNTHNKTRVSNRADSFLTIIENIRLLCKNNLTVLLRLNLTNDNILSAFEIPSYLSNFTTEEKAHINMICEHVWQDIKNGSLFDQIIELRKEFNKVGIKSLGKNKDSIRNTCYADKQNSITINYNGDVFKCTAEDFTLANRNGILANNGEILFNEDPYLTLLNKRKEKSICKNCRILPLCYGGCYKKMMKLDHNICLFPTEKDKNQLILENVEDYLLMHPISLE